MQKAGCPIIFPCSSLSVAPLSQIATPHPSPCACEVFAAHAAWLGLFLLWAALGCASAPAGEGFSGDFTRDFTFQQFQKDAKDAQELLKKVDTDLDQKYSPEFKDRYQLESLLRELDVSTGGGRTGGSWSIPTAPTGAGPAGAGTQPLLLPPCAQLFLPLELEIASPTAT